MGVTMRTVKWAVIAAIVLGVAFLSAAEKTKNKTNKSTAPAPITAPEPTLPAPAPALAPAEPAAAPAPDPAPAPVEPAPAPEPEKPVVQEKKEEPKEQPAPAPAAPAAPEKPAWVDPAPYGSVGVGLGVLYGFFGINADVHPIQIRWWDGITLTASVGQTNIGQFAFSGGIRYFVLPRDYGWRPRITITYGINATTDYNIALITDTGTINFREKKTHHGLNIGVGLQYMFGEDRRHGLDVDLVVLAYSSVNKHIDDLEKDPNIAPYIGKDDKPFPLVVSFGYRLAF